MDALVEKIIRAGKRPLFLSPPIASYHDLFEEMEERREAFVAMGLPERGAIALEGKLSLSLLGAFLALILLRRAVLLIDRPLHHFSETMREAGVSFYYRIEDGHSLEFSHSHPLLDRSLEEKKASLLLYTSGFTGRSKLALHHLDHWVTRVKRGGAHSYRALFFYPIDTMGGIDLLFYLLATKSSCYLPKERSLYAIVTAIEKERLDFLPATPSFLRSLVGKQREWNQDLSSLKKIVWGGEPLADGEREALETLFPQANLLQSYGTTESAVIPGTTLPQGWLQVDTTLCQLRLRGDSLELKKEGMMVGYLNGPSPFTEDGWYRTLDRAELAGDRVRILGRLDRSINVAGLLIEAAKVEEQLWQLSLFRWLHVYGATNPITQEHVAIECGLKEGIEEENARRLIETFSREKLPKAMRPREIHFFQGERPYTSWKLLHE